MRTRFVVLAFCIVARSVAQTSSQQEMKCPEQFHLVLPNASIYTDLDKVILPPPKCYRFVLDKMPFQDAADACVNMNAKLATPRTREMSAGIIHYVIAGRLPRMFWIGLTDRVSEGFLTWIDDEPLDEDGYSPWLKSEPDSKKSAAPGSKAASDDCVKLALFLRDTTYSARWFDTVCTRKEAFLCETDPLGPVATSVTKISESSTYQYGPTEDLGKLIRIDEPLEVKDEVTEETNLSTKFSSTTPPTFSTTTQKTKYPIKLVAYAQNNGNATRLQPTPASGNVGTSKRQSCKLGCTSNVMIAACPLQMFPLINDTRAVLNNRSCVTRRNGTHLLVHTTLDGCGTVARNLRGGQVSFQNTIRFYSEGTAVVREPSELASLTDFMILECRYPQKHQLQQNFRPEENKPQVHFSVSNGPSLPHAFMLYKTEQFDCPYGKQDFPVRISVSRRLYFEVRLRIASLQVEIHPISCRATPDRNFLNPKSYIMMEDGCIVDPTFTIEPSNSSKISRFSVQAFRFVGYFRQVYIQCELIVCKLNSPSSPSCPYECQTDKERKRRSIDDIPPDSLVHTTLGPIAIVSDEVEFSGFEVATADSNSNEHQTSDAQRGQGHTPKPQALRDSEAKRKTPANTKLGVAKVGGDGGKGTRLFPTIITFAVAFGITLIVA